MEVYRKSSSFSRFTIERQQKKCLSIAIGLFLLCLFIYSIEDKKRKKMLTVLLPRFFTRQFKYAVLPSSAVTLFDAALSKYGPTLNASKSSAFGLEPYTPAAFPPLPLLPPLLSFAFDESRCDANTVISKREWKNDKCIMYTSLNSMC